MALDSQISKRISIAKYLMVIGIVVIHTPPYQYLHELGHTWTDILRIFFAHGVFKASVPVLATISGYLLFRSKLHLQIKKLISKKTKSLLLPLIAWNLPFAIIIYAMQKVEFSAYSYWVDLHPFNLLNWMQAVLGLTGTPINYPLHFMRDLFVIAMLSPLIWIFLKRIPYLGFFIILGIFWFNLDGHLVQRDTMFITFYIGALAATQQWNLKSLDQYSLHLTVLFFLACILITVFRIDEKEYFIIASPFLIWPAISLIAETRIGEALHKYSNTSFFLFLSHVPIMFFFYKIYMVTFSQVPYFVFWIICPTITVLTVIPILQIARNTFPNTAQLVLGGR